MESRPQVPKKSHGKNISVTSTVEMQEGNMNMSKKMGGRATVKRNAGVELVPRPSDSPLDPLNWPQWKKELTFGSLVLGSACVGILKTILVTVNSVIATELSSSYMAATALTGVPWIFGALSGLGSVVLAQKIGKRGIYIASASLMLIGAVWNMHVYESYAQFMVSRLLQGISWGAYESLVLISVKDMFFVHERSRRVMMYNISNIFFTWGTPILGGYLSQNNEGFRNQIMAVNIIQAFSIALLIFATPETTFSRSSIQGDSTFQPTTVTTVSSPSAGKFKSYLSTLRLTTPHSTSKFQLSRALLPLRALSAPSTILTFLLTAPLVATAFATANTLSLIFTAMPVFLLPARIGYLFIGPFATSLVAFSLASLAAFLRSRPPHHLTASKHLATAIPGLVLGVAGSLSFGLYTYGKLMSFTLDKGSVFSLYIQGQDLSLKVVSLLFGLLVSGAVVVNFGGVMHLKYATALGSSVESDVVEGAHRVLQDILTGIFIVGMPVWVDGAQGMLAGLKDTIIALGVVQIVVGSSVAALMWAKGDAVVKLDGRVLGRRAREMGHQRTKTNDSFFEA